MKKNPASTSPEHRPDGGSPEDGQMPTRRVRDRTLRHLRKLLADTGTAGAALCMSGCIGCDPPPPPVDCTSDLTTSYIHEWAYWRAQWINTEDQLSILVEVDLWDYEKKLAFAGEPTLEGATLLESEITETSMMFTFTPLEGVTSVTAFVPMQCEDTDRTVQLAMDVRGTPQTGERVPISAVDEPRVHAENREEP